MTEEANTAFGEPQWWRKPGVYQNLKTMFEGILAAPRPDVDRAYQKLLYAGSAWRGGAYDDARRLFDEIGDQRAEERFWTFFGCPLARARGEVYAATGPLGEQVGRAEALYLAGNVNQALTLFQEALVSATDEEVVTYLRDRAVALRIEAVQSWCSHHPKHPPLLPALGFGRALPGLAPRRHRRRGTVTGSHLTPSLSTLSSSVPWLAP